MIAKISSGKDTAGLIRYLFDTKKAKDHIDPHLVASWDGFAPDPGRTDDFTATKKLLVADLDLRVKQARRLGRAPERHVWHCSLRTATTDRHLSDEEWADIARRVMAATGIAPQDDPDGCRWVAVRHAPDHIHIAATKVRGDLGTARHWNDYLTADRELVEIEKEYGLHRVVRGDRTAAKRPTRAEQEKARRQGRQKTSRERLRTTVRQLVSIATSPEEFLSLLDGVEGVVVDIQHFPSGDIRGYKVAVEGDTNAAGEPVWFSGSQLAPDLSFPKVAERLTGIAAPSAIESSGPCRADSWHQATAAAEHIPRQLDGGDDAVAQAHITAFGEALDVLPLLAPGHLRIQLLEAASAFERASRSRVRAKQDQARVLRGAVRALRAAPVTGDVTGLAMFLDVAVLVVIATARWHRARRHDQQAAAAHQALAHLQAAFQQAATQPLTTLIRNQPSAHTAESYAQHVRAVLPDHAEQVLNDVAWPVLAAALARAETTGHASRALIQRAAAQRALDDARSPARTLAWRIQRLAPGQASSDRAQTAQAPAPVRSGPAPSSRHRRAATDFRHR
ncbi:relaxase/mobilization nuclease domain-containing protein [Streptomyces sp. NPDC047853]|uniref:relaxase/mobilization nuclease domain-containing protein n=1 Tax=unclassified Streptomyces TaxID=2593676 RepID=UPI00345537A7